MNEIIQKLINNGENKTSKEEITLEWFILDKNPIQNYPCQGCNRETEYQEVFEI